MSLVVVGGGSKIPFRLTSRLSVETETPARHQKIRSILWFVSKSTDGAPLALVRVAGVALVVLVGRFVKANARHGRRLPVAAVHEPQRVPAPAKKKYRLGKQFPNLWVKLPPGGRSTQAPPPTRASDSFSTRSKSNTPAVRLGRQFPNLWVKLPPRRSIDPCPLPERRSHSQSRGQITHEGHLTQSLFQSY